MSLKGQLETSDFATLLQLLYHERKTGVLQVSDGANKVKIFVKDGNIAHASSSQKKRRLGYLLRAKRVLSAKGLQECLKLCEEKRQPLGRVVVEKGHITPGRLKTFLRHQARQILYDVFLWKGGRFEYKEIPVRIEAKPGTLMNTIEIVLEASRRIDELSVIKKQITDDNLVFKLAEGTGSKEEIKLTKKEWRILALIDGSRTIGQVVAESEYEKLAAHKIIHSLLASGLIKKTAAARQEKEDAVDYSRIIKICIDILRVIHKNIETELGKRVYGLFDECKTRLLPKERSFFEDLDMRKSAETNTHAMFNVMYTFQDFEQGFLFLRRGFNTFLKNILQREAKLLGLHITRKTLREAKQTLAYVKEYQQESDEKARILGEIEQVVEKVGHEITGQDGRGGGPGKK